MVGEKKEQGEQALIYEMLIQVRILFIDKRVHVPTHAQSPEFST